MAAVPEPLSLQLSFAAVCRLAGQALQHRLGEFGASAAIHARVFAARLLAQGHEQRNHSGHGGRATSLLIFV